MADKGLSVRSEDGTGDEHGYVVVFSPPEDRRGAPIRRMHYVWSWPQDESRPQDAPPFVSWQHDAAPPRGRWLDMMGCRSPDPGPASTVLEDVLAILSGHMTPAAWRQRWTVWKIEPRAAPAPSVRWLHGGDVPAADWRKDPAAAIIGLLTRPAPGARWDALLGDDEASTELLNDFFALAFLSWGCLHHDPAAASGTLVGTFAIAAAKVKEALAAARVPADAFAGMSPAERLAILRHGTGGEPEQRMLAHLDRVRLRFGLALNGTPSAWARGDRKRAETLARYVTPAWAYHTRSIFAVAWLEFAWAIQEGMRLAPCNHPGCGRLYLATSGKYDYCAAHAVGGVPGMDAAAQRAYAKYRQRGGVESPEEWMSRYRPKQRRR